MNSFLLGEFMHWLYEPSQQNALTLEGFLPVASDQSVREFWGRQHPANAPLFDAQRVFQARRELSDVDDTQLSRACEQLYHGAKPTAVIKALQTGAVTPCIGVCPQYT